MKWTEKVTKLMKEKGYNQKDLSEKSGISEPSISRYLKEERTPRIDIIINFAKALDVTTDYLLDDDFKKYSKVDDVKHTIAKHGNELSEEEENELIEYIRSLNKKDVL